MSVGTWNFSRLYRAGSLAAIARELARYKLDLVGVQDVRWEKGGTVRAGDYNFLYGKGNVKYYLGADTEYYQQLRKWILLASGCHI